jgi:hypothetical protein
LNRFEICFTKKPFRFEGLFLYYFAEFLLALFEKAKKYQQNLSRIFVGTFRVVKKTPTTFLPTKINSFCLAIILKRAKKPI